FPNFQSPLNIKFRNTNIEEFQFSSHLYNNIITIPFFKTTDAFIDQKPAPNNQNITSTNSYETTTEEFQASYLNFETAHTCTIGTTEAFVDLGLMLNNQNTMPIHFYDIATEEFQYSSSNFEISYPYDGVRTTEVFIDQEQAPNNSL
ncbi:17963_t:CDS:1, partial [Racocetra fulgida]